MSHLLRLRAVHAPLFAALLLAAPGAAIAGKAVDTKQASTAGETAAGNVDEAALDVGRQVFATDAAPPCAICHTLADAEASGEVGPNLDQLQPASDLVRQAVTDGVGIMPSYADTLSSEQIEAVARYVSQVAGQGS